MPSGNHVKNEISCYFFYRENSPDCQITRRILYATLERYRNRIITREIDYDQNRDICREYHVYGVPTLLIMKNAKELNRYSGILDAHEVDCLLKPAISEVSEMKGENQYE